MLSTVYIKPMTWVGETHYYVGLQPSNPQAAPGHRLGSYWLQCRTREEALAVARHEAQRMRALGHAYAADPVECPVYVGL